ncbi:hypothetical protein PHLCEN_2v8155 [Hermanssonia centrifuga]|uniref:Uncharacterized protein n=1 Tax=Hermanssonia centrifuga TaxID=98765 RepID=A0A2R6NUL1_9APHY|nr:hypothetical protein PHLCEN_2v8155 [Hermanssonia centrifuga]
MVKAAQKKKQTTTAPPVTRLSTRAKNANAHPGLVDISEESDPEKAQRRSKRKEVKAKAKVAKEVKEANVAEIEQLIAKLQSEIAQRDACEVVSRRYTSIADPEQLASPASPIEEMEEPVVPLSSPIEEIPDNVAMVQGEAGNNRDGSEASQSPFDSDTDATDGADDMEVEETEVEVPGVADAAVVPGGALRRSNAAFFGRNNQGEVVILDRASSGDSYDLHVASEPLSKRQNQPKKRKAVAHASDSEDDIPEAATASRTKASDKRPAKPVA